MHRGDTNHICVGWWMYNKSPHLEQNAEHDVMIAKVLSVFRYNSPSFLLLLYFIWKCSESIIQEIISIQCLVSRFHNSIVNWKVCILVRKQHTKIDFQEPISNNPWILQSIFTFYLTLVNNWYSRDKNEGKDISAFILWKMMRLCFLTLF